MGAKDDQFKNIRNKLNNYDRGQPVSGEVKDKVTPQNNFLGANSNIITNENIKK